MFDNNVLLVADDYLESGILKRVAEELPSSLFPSTFLGFGKQQNQGVSSLSCLVSDSDGVLVAMSDWNANEVRAALLAIKHRKPLALMALGYGAWKKAAFLSVREHAEILFVIDKQEAADAAPYFPAARIVVSGNPEWEGFETPALSRKEVRGKLGVKPGETVVLVSCEKSLRVNFPLAACVIEALSRLADETNWRVIFSIHPGHEILDGVDLVPFYQRELQAYDRQRLTLDVSCKTVPFGIGAPDMVAGADVVIGIKSTLQIQAAFQRIPSISIFLRPLLEYEAASPKSWPPVERGAIAGVYDFSAKTTAALIRKLVSPLGFDTMHKAQRRAFKPLKKGAANKIICGHLVELAK